MNTAFSNQQIGLERRWVLAGLLTGLAVPLLASCTKVTESFKSTDITGVTFGQDFRLKDHFGQERSLADFRGKVVVVFFGFTQCPDVCPTSMSTMAEVKRLLGDNGKDLQVVFITVDPERDTQSLLKEYMSNFDPTFLALRPDPQQLPQTAADFKIYYKRVEGKTSTSYTMDHSAGKYIFDKQGRIRLFSAYGTEAKVIADDIRLLMQAS